MSVPRLDPDDFARFFRAVNDGRLPFPWQERLAHLVIEKGWPEALDVPTGAGKTSSIDVAVFHLAIEATKGPRRRAPVRIVFVVDRRLVVDEAYERALKVASALEQATEGILLRVKQRLGLLSERADLPLVVSRLRGGTAKEPDWIRTPSQPAVVVSTVDQVGSRLFFRGYGVSDTMKPVHAGLLGSDALYLLDEAHLSQPFVRAVRDSRVYQVSNPWSKDAAPAPFGVVTLSATPTHDAAAPALIKADDRKHPTLGPRLNAPKRVQLVSVAADPGGRSWIEAFVEQAWSLSSAGGGTAETTAVVVNRVGRARAIHDVLRTRLGEAGKAETALLIGPSRPLERDARIKDLMPRIAVRREHASNPRPLIVVATQCIEAGADLDFDALVTEIAPLDCLRQRFGRLNRTGRAIDARGVIIAGAGQAGGRVQPDTIYGESLAATWGFLSEKADAKANKKSDPRWIDFGIEASRNWLPEKDGLARFLAPRGEAPVMMPAFVEQWTNTSPIPTADPEVSLFLHGPRAGPADVQLVWRADLAEDAEHLWAERIGVCPPSSLEAVSVPLYAARAWLRSQVAPDLADAELTPREEERAEPGRTRRALRWRGPDDRETRPIGPSEIAPGDTLVVPSLYGGCDEWGWSPSAPALVSDIATEANRQHRRLEILRLAPELAEAAWRAHGLDEAASRTRAERLRKFLLTLSNGSDAQVRDALGSDDRVPPAWREEVEKGGRLERYGPGTDVHGVPLALVRPAVSTVYAPRPAEGAVGHAVTEDDSSSRSSRAVELGCHSRGVRDLAETFAQQLGLGPDTVSDLACAALLHDAGKAHPGFKRWLCDGDELAALVAPDLAKSGRRLGPDARARAGLPSRARHEIASLAYAQEHPAFRKAHDPELVLWLVGTHHGYGRPFFPAVDWPPPGSEFATDLGEGPVRSAPAPKLATLTARWCDIQARLTRKYGPWGLARLEAIVRLADHRRSQSEQEEG